MKYIYYLSITKARCTDPGTYLANFETIEEAMVVKLFLQQMNTGNLFIHILYKKRRFGRNVKGTNPNKRAGTVKKKTITFI